MYRQDREPRLRRYRLPFGVPAVQQPEIPVGTYVIAFDYELGDHRIREGVLVEYRGPDQAILEGFNDEKFVCQIPGMETRSNDELSERDLAFANIVRRRNRLPDQ